MKIISVVLQNLFLRTQHIHILQQNQKNDEQNVSLGLKHWLLFHRRRLQQTEYYLKNAKFQVSSFEIQTIKIISDLF